jgi:hypothetical protein
MPDDLAGGFQIVDAASDFAVFSSCLTLIDSLPFFAECKRESSQRLGAGSWRLAVDWETTPCRWQDSSRRMVQSSPSTEAKP